MSRFWVRVHPRAGENRVELVEEGVLEVWTRVPAIEGRANEAVCRLVAEWQRVPVSAVRLVAGARGRTKIIEIAPEEC